MYNNIFRGRTAIRWKVPSNPKIKKEGIFEITKSFRVLNEDMAQRGKKSKRYRAQNVEYHEGFKRHNALCSSVQAIAFALFTPNGTLWKLASKLTISVTLCFSIEPGELYLF